MNNSNERIYWPGWETVRLIGRGSFGAVYEIQRRIFDETEKAALKVITIPQNEGDIDEMRSDGYDDESITATFHSHLKSIVGEYSTMRKMNGSANIVNCDDVRYEPHGDEIGWDVYIKMELLTPLVKSLPDPIPEEIVIRVGRDICAALELCRKYDVVHRDIKPQNIFLSDNGDYKLGDFGVAKTVEKTMGGTKIGTYKYMAPEVYNNQPYGTAADIYSLGLVLYWMLNDRRLPFMPMGRPTVGADEEARYRRFSGEPIPAPKHGSEELKRIVLKACAFDPKERFSSAQEMLDALEHVQQGRTVLREEPAPNLEEKIRLWSQTAPVESDEDQTVGLFTVSKPTAPEEKKAEPVAMPEIEIPRAEPVRIAEAVQPEEKTAPVFESKPVPKKKPELVSARGEPKPVEETVSRRIEVPKQALQPVEEPTPKKNNPWIIGACAVIVTVVLGLILNYMGILAGQPLDYNGGVIASGTCGVNVTWELSANGVLNVRGEGEMTNYTLPEHAPWHEYKEMIQEISIKEGVTVIGSFAFSNIASLISADIADSVTWIGQGAFSGCSELRKIELSANLEVIHMSAFANCTNLTRISFPDSLLWIDMGAFSNCKELRSVEIPVKVENLGQDAFSECEKLHSITILNPNILCGSEGDYDGTLGVASVTTVRAYEGSDAQSYAEKYGFAFEAIG